MHKIFRFVYLNIYAFLLLFCGILVAFVPLFKVSMWLIIPQAIVCLFFIKKAIQLFATWKDKMVKYDILIRRNKNEFHPKSFQSFMQAPCGRLLTKAVLKDLRIKYKYQELLALKKPFIVSIKQSCEREETKIYINKDFY